jgi:hypothetical protein
MRHEVVLTHLTLARRTAMTESKPDKNAPVSAEDIAVQPSWTPLYWLVGTIIFLVFLWELMLDLLLEFGETLFLVLVEAPEEFLEDILEEWLKVHYPHQADRYSEMITAIGLTPVKIITGLIFARWLWVYTHGNLFPKWVAFFKRQSLAVWLAWKAVFWPYKILAVFLVLGVLAVII